MTDDWYVSLNASVTDGKYDNALVPCRDVDFDGVPDAGNNPSAADFAANVPGQSVAYCSVNDSISTLPPWSMTLQSEYNFPVRTAQGYVRGLFTYFGENDNLGARSDEAGWDVSLWAKNVFDEEVLLNRGGTDTGIAFGLFETGYQSVTYNRPREVGVTLRYAFHAD